MAHLLKVLMASIASPPPIKETEEVEGDYNTYTCILAKPLTIEGSFTYDQVVTDDSGVSYINYDYDSSLIQLPDGTQIDIPDWKYNQPYTNEYESKSWSYSARYVAVYLNAGDRFRVYKDGTLIFERAPSEDLDIAKRPYYIDISPSGKYISVIAYISYAHYAFLLYEGS